MEINSKYSKFALTSLKKTRIAAKITSDKVLSSSLILANTAAKSSILIANKSKEIAKKAKKRGKIDNRVLDSITIQSMNNNIESWIQSEYERNQDELIKQPLKNLYKQWLRWLNEYVLLNVFGHLIVLDQAKCVIENTTSYNEDERKLNVISLLFVEIKALKKWIKYTNANMSMYLDQEDDDWLSNTIFLITSKPKQNSLLLGRALAHLNNTCATLLNNINDLERSTSVIEEAIKMQNLGIGGTVGNMLQDPKNLNPWFLLNNFDNVAANVIPGFFTGKARKRALNQYMTCVQEYDFLINSIIPPIIVTTKRNNVSSISSIIDRDFKYIGKKNLENSEIKRALFKRILRLEALKRFTKIEKKKTLWMSYEGIIKKIVSLSTDCINKNNPL